MLLKIVPPLRIVGGLSVIAKIDVFGEKDNGVISKTIIPTIKDNLIIFLGFRFLLHLKKNSLDRIDNPNEEKILLSIKMQIFLILQMRN